MTAPPPSAQPRIGEIWWVNFTPQAGNEQRGSRPGLVISNDHYNRSPHGFAIVIPLTTTDRRIRTQVRIDPPEAGLQSVSFCMCEQVKALSLGRFGDRLGTVSPATLRSVQDIVLMFFDD